MSPRDSSAGDCRGQYIGTRYAIKRIVESRSTQSYYRADHQFAERARLQSDDQLHPFQPQPFGLHQPRHHSELGDLSGRTSDLVRLATRGRRIRREEPSSFMNILATSHVHKSKHLCSPHVCINGTTWNIQARMKPSLLVVIIVR